MHANQSFIIIFYIPHLNIWGERLLWGAVYYHTSYKMQYFPIFFCFCLQDKLHSFNIQDHRSTRGLLISETVQNISKITYTAAGSNFWQAPNLRRNFQRVTLQRDEEFIESIFFNGFITMCNLKKAFDTLGILSTPASDVCERLKTNGKAMKITLLRLPTINKEI